MAAMLLWEQIGITIARHQKFDGLLTQKPSIHNGGSFNIRDSFCILVQPLRMAQEFRKREEEELIQVSRKF